MDTCFKAFDKDEDGFLNQSEFSALCRALFRNECGKPYTVEPTMLTKIFQIFDTNKDNVIDKEEFKFCWQRWIKQVVRPVTALVVVDVQNDFISGSLAICHCPAQHKGEEDKDNIRRRVMSEVTNKVALDEEVLDDQVQHDKEDDFFTYMRGGDSQPVVTPGRLQEELENTYEGWSKVIPPINKLLEEVKFDTVVYSLDWHPTDHVSFVDNISKKKLHADCKIRAEDAAVYDVILFDVRGDGQSMEQKMWPRHCVQNTWGSELHKDLKLAEDPILIYKGTDPDVDSYSAFWDNNKVNHTALNEALKKRGVTDVFVCGIAYDVCVAATANHAIDAGYRTMLVDDACRGVCDQDIGNTKQQVIDTHGMVIQSPQVKGLASGRDRPPVLGFKLALELAKELAARPGLLPPKNAV